MIHRRSKISRLPEAVITQINEFLDANVEYARILDWLNEQGHHDLEHYHISRWRDTGYQDWLHAQEHQAAMDRQLQWAANYAAGDYAQFHNAAMNLIVLKLFDAINRLDPADINRLLESRSDMILTLVNTFARYSHAVVAKDRFKEELRVTAVTEHRAKAPKERLPDELRRRVFEELRLALQVPASAIPAPAPE